MSKQTKASASSNKKFNYYLIPVILAAAVMPLIVRLAYVPTNLSEFSWYDNKTEVADVFLYNKMVFFICVSVFAIVMLGFKLLTEGRKIKFSKAFLPLLVYGIFSLLSAIFSEYTNFSFNGIIDQFEPVWVLLGYCLMAYYTFLVIVDSKDVNVILISILISCLILSIIGVSQFLKHDFFSTELGRTIIVPEKYADVRDSLSFEFEGSLFNSAYATLYNPNYVGSYAVLLIPIFMLSFFARKKWYWNVITAVSFVLLIVTFLASGSKTGFIAIAASVLFFFIICHKLIRKHFKLSAGILVSIAIVFIGVNYLAGFNLITYVKNALTVTKDSFPLESIVMGETAIEITYNNNLVYINAEITEDQTVSFTVWDENNTVLTTNINPDNGMIMIEDERFPGFELGAYNTEDLLLFGVTIDGYPWYFTNQTGDGSYQYISPTLKYAEIKPAENALKGYEKFASGRGFIWGMTIPLLKDHIILGSGPDTFTVTFPQDDFISSTNAAFRNTIVSRPHNMYLQIGVQTGVLSLIAFIVFYIVYFISSIRIYTKLIPDNLLTCTGIGILLGTLGYMVVGFANDSTICVAPVFWILMGSGIAINKIVKDKTLITDNNK